MCYVNKLYKMLNKICIYNNKLFLALDTSIIVYSCRKCLKSENEKFQECFKIELPVKCVNVYDIKLQVIENYATGLKSLVIVLFEIGGQFIVLIYNYAFMKKLRRIIVPFSASSIEDISTNFFVSDGPSFLHCSSDSFYLYSVPNGVTNNCDYKFIFCDIKEQKVLQFKCVKFFKNDHSERYLYLLIVSCNFSSQQQIKIVGYVSDMEKLISCSLISMHYFFPQSYEIILKSAQITKVVPVFRTDSVCIKEIEWKETASVICTKNDCFVFSNSTLMYCFNLTLPLTSVMCMKVEFNNNLHKNSNLVLTFENKMVFFITLQRNGTWEVSKYWTDIEATLVGDILMKGSKQVLLLKQTDFDSWQNNNIMYDMSSFIPINFLCHGSMPDKCLKTTISGLKRKAQSGKSSIKEMEYEISQKSAATIDALIKLNGFRVHAESLKSSDDFQQSLVDLILSKDENKLETIPVKCEPYIKLLNESQQLIDNQCIISLCFLNEGERCICNPSLKVLMKGDQVPCTQKLFICNTDTTDYLVSSECFRQINQKTKFYITLTFEVSFFNADDTPLILTWYAGSIDEFDNDVFINEEKKSVIQSQICVQTRIESADVLQHLVTNDISSPSYFLFVRALQQRVNLNISSLHSDISKLEDILMKNNFDSKNLYCLENTSSKCIIFNNEKKTLYGVYFTITKARQHLVEIQACTRKEREICLLIHYLYQHLPEDIMISPCLKFKDKLLDMRKNVAISMKNEMDILISSLNLHNISEEIRKSYSKLVTSQTVGTIAIPKKNYHRIRTVLVKKECITDSLIGSII